MPRFDDLQIFVAVVEAGSFTAAADRLGLAKSAISRRVAALEERLGATLLNRTTRRLNLTEAGTTFYDRGLTILADLDEAEAAVAAEQGELRGRLRVALPLSFGIRHMCQPIAEFCRLHPGIEFSLDLNDRQVDLVEEGADLAIRIGRLRDSSMIARRVFDARTVIAAAPDYLEQHGRPRTPQQLAGHACLVYSNLADPGTWVCRDVAGKRFAVEVDVAMSASSGDFLCNMAVHGLGIVMQPTFIASAAINSGELVPILTEYEWPVTPAYAIYPPTRRLSSRVRAFIDFVAAQFEGVPYWDMVPISQPQRT